ncbi:MAG: extracellular solute-binding protein [Treponema sp.]|jgi:ABC-type glycerol-3-phosphate transport system substrate-binding protein/DNA-binding transcriptional regulator YhcF (GntR family)|nr:extracellular solute-binding protein [Treponema sp.]
MAQDLLDRYIAVPLHVQVRQVLSNRIKGGEYQLGSRIPNEFTLSQEFKVSRPTIRSALYELEKIGMVKRVRPKGTFVSTTMKRSWFEDTVDAPAVLSPSESAPIRIAIEETLADLYLIHNLESFSASSGCKVELIHWVNWYDAIENIINKFAEKKAPDVFTVSNDAVGIFAKMGVIRPLDEFIDGETLRRIKARCLKYGMNAYIYNDRLYGYPFFSETRLLVYRKDHFRNAGIPDPALYPLTHESFLEAAKALSNPEKDIYAFAYMTGQHPQTLQSTLPWIIQRGGRLFRIEHGRILSATEEPAFIEGLRWYTDLTTKHRVCPPVSSSLTIRDLLVKLRNGKISMLVVTPDILKWLEDTSEEIDLYGLAPLPSGPVNNYSFMGGMPLCISSICGNPRSAWELISYICSKDVLVPYLNRTGDMIPIEIYDVEEIVRHCPERLRPVAYALETAVPHTYPAGYNQILDFMVVGYWQIPLPQVLSRILWGELSVEGAAQYLNMTMQSFFRTADH